MDRDACPVVVLSGKALRYRDFYARLGEELSRRGILQVETRFFGFARGVNSEVLVAPLRQDAVREVLCDVVIKWATGSLVSPAP